MRIVRRSTDPKDKVIATIGVQASHVVTPLMSWLYKALDGKPGENLAEAFILGDKQFFLRAWTAMGRRALQAMPSNYHPSDDLGGISFAADDCDESSELKNVRKRLGKLPMQMELTGVASTELGPLTPKQKQVEYLLTLQSRNDGPVPLNGYALLDTYLRGRMGQVFCSEVMYADNKGCIHLRFVINGVLPAA